MHYAKTEEFIHSNSAGDFVSNSLHSFFANGEELDLEKDSRKEPCSSD